MNKSKILIIVPRYDFANEKYYDYTFPLGLGYISSVLKKAGYSVDCLNLNHLDGPINKIIQSKLDKKKYDFVGIGNTAMGYVVTEIIIKIIREHSSNPKIILGGAIITPQPMLVFTDLKPDFGVLGEGEETVLELLKGIEKKQDLSKVKGLIYKDINGKIVITEKRTPVQNLDSLPVPDFEGFGFAEQLDHRHANKSYSFTFDNPRPYPILCSRSCPFKCTFCYHEGNYRARSIDNIMEELDLMVKKYKINIIIIYDDCFAIDKKRLEEFCRRIKKLRKEISWDLVWICSLTVRDVTVELIKMLKDAGCEAIGYGFESYSPIVLKSMCKPITPEQIDNAIKITLKEKVSIQGGFIFGDVAETKETAKKTIDYWKKNLDGQIILRFVQPYPGSKIYEHCLKKGIIKDRIKFIKTLGEEERILNMTDGMTDEELYNLRRDTLEAISKYSKFVRARIKKSAHNVYELNLKCPYCDKNLTYKNCIIENPNFYSFVIQCRGCSKRFYVVSNLKKLVFQHYYKFYNIIRKMKNIYVPIKNNLKKMRFRVFNQ